MPGNC